MSDNRKAKKSVSGLCPSCDTRSSFQLIGVQEWHPEIARKLNVPPKIHLYRCDNCDSSINEFALRDDSATAG